MKHVVQTAAPVKEGVELTLTLTRIQFNPQVNFMVFGEDESKKPYSFSINCRPNEKVDTFAMANDQIMRAFGYYEPIELDDEDQASIESYRNILSGFVGTQFKVKSVPSNKLNPQTGDFYYNVRMTSV